MIINSKQFSPTLYLYIFNLITSSVILTSNKNNEKTIFLLFNKKKIGIILAGVSGLEPERNVLETLILPLYYTPNTLLILS